MVEIKKDTLLADALSDGNVQAVAEVLKGFGMHCFGCALAKGETVGDAALAHGVDAQAMIDALTKARNS